MGIDKPYFVSPAWKVLIHDLGASHANVLRRAGLPQDLFARERAALSTQEFFRLWDGIVREVGDSHIALRIGSAISVESFDPPVFAALCSPDLNTAMFRISQYKRLMCELSLHVDAGRQGTEISFEWMDKAAAPPPSLIVSKLVYFVQLARIGIRERIVPLKVESPALPSPLQPYSEFFGTALIEGRNPVITFSQADAARPFLTANESMWSFFEPSLKKRLADLTESSTTGEKVHSSLLELLPSGGASLNAVAQRLGTSPRTLRRRLKAEGHSFQAILDGTREKLAEHYLRSTDLSGAEISFLLGFEDPNSFFRAFKNWTGTTPDSVRRESAQRLLALPQTSAGIH